MQPPFSVTIQPTRRLHMRRVDDGWLVWLHGTPHTPHHTYLYLRDNGTMQRVTEDAYGNIEIVEGHSNEA